MLLSIIIPTRNEARNIGPCIDSLASIKSRDDVEVIVVDNYSSDSTVELAKQKGVRVVSCGNERSAQKNHGALKDASGAYVFFVDADMRIPSGTMTEVLKILTADGAPDGLYVREEMVGDGFWIKIRNFERSFYDSTCIDALRVIKTSLVKAVGGYDVSLFAGEDWDLDRRILALTDSIGITEGALRHDEGRFSLRGHFRKKRYYASNFNVYCSKWSYDGIIKKQMGAKYRLWTVFVENGNWRRSLRRPHYLFMIWFYKIVVGVIFYVGASSAEKRGA